MKNNFRFWVPIQKIEKGNAKKGNPKQMILGGIASTSAKDTDGQNLIPEGFDISYLKQRGFINWNHNKTPDAYIGEPSKAIIKKGQGLYVEATLYPDSVLAQKVYKLAKVLEKNSSKRKLGFSIEGKAVEFDLINPSKVTKARITGVAITPSPKNPTSIVNIIKGEVDWTEEDESEINDEELELMLDKGNNTFENLSKAEVYELIFENRPVITFGKANLIYEKIKNLAMATKKAKTNDLLEKALNALNIETEDDGEEVEKGEDDDFDEGEEMAKGEEEDDTQGGEEEDEEDDEDEEDEEPKKKPAKKKKSLKKAIVSGTVKPATQLPILKAIANSAAQSKRQSQALGVLLKCLFDEFDTLKEENTLMKSQIDELNDQITTSNSNVESLLSAPPVGRKSVTKAIERGFEKSHDASQDAGTQMSVTSHKTQILNKLDELTFEKGMDSKLADEMTSYEAGGNLSAYAIQRLKAAGITLVR